MTMGKGLEAILKGPSKLKQQEKDEVATDVVTTAPVVTGEVITKERSAIERTTEEVSTAEIHTGEVITKEESTAEVITDVVATAQVTTGGVTIRQEVIARAISDAKRSPRISTWSPIAMGTLKTLWMTQPQFSMSNEIRTLIEEGLARKYPELVEMVKKELEKSS